MCFHSRQSKNARALEKRFRAKIEQAELFEPSDHYNGFTFPKTPVVANEQPGLIRHFQWGLIPFWAKDEGIRQYTLNAKIETLHKKPSFRQAVKNRCLVIADGFYEWQWLDPKGRQKQKFLVKLPGDALFAFAGIWSEWAHPATGEVIHSYSIVTTEANELMSRIHNSKKRMPVILTETNEKDWLEGREVADFAGADPELQGEPL
ncbi:MAG: SOS response-associated peptidase [Bacteroidales bacterium]